MRRIGRAILEVVVIVLGISFCLLIDILALFSKRARKYKEEQKIKVSYMHAD